TSVTEAAHTGTTGANYTMGAAVCDNSITPDGSGNFTMPDANVTCSRTDARRARTVTVNKVLSPSAEPGKFDLKIGGTTVSGGNGVGDGGTGNTAMGVGAATSVTEAAHTGTTGANYTMGAAVCDNSITPDGSGNFTMPDANVTCS